VEEEKDLIQTKRQTNGNENIVSIILFSLSLWLGFPFLSHTNIRKETNVSPIFFSSHNFTRSNKMIFDFSV